MISPFTTTTLLVSPRPHNVVILPTLPVSPLPGRPRSANQPARSQEAFYRHPESSAPSVWEPGPSLYGQVCSRVHRGTSGAQDMQPEPPEGTGFDKEVPIAKVLNGQPCTT